MTNTDLKALRRFFFLDVNDAATYIGNCSARAWQRWESGQHKIPNDVISMMNQLKLERAEIFAILSSGSYQDITSKGFLYSRLIESVQAEMLAKNRLNSLK